MAKRTFLALSLLCSGVSVVLSDATAEPVVAQSENSSLQVVADQISDTVTVVVTHLESPAQDVNAPACADTSSPASPSEQDVSDVLAVVGKEPAVSPVPFSWKSPSTWGLSNLSIKHHVTGCFAYIYPFLSEEEKAAKVQARQVVVQEEQKKSGSWLKAHEFLPQLVETEEQIALKAQVWETTSTQLAHTLVKGFIAAKGDSDYIKNVMQQEFSKISDVAQRAQLVDKMTTLLECMKAKAIAEFASISRAGSSDMTSAFSDVTAVANTYESLKQDIEKQKSLFVEGAHGNIITRNPGASLAIATLGLAATGACAVAVLALSANDLLKEQLTTATGQVAQAGRQAVIAAAAVARQTLQTGVNQVDVSAEGVQGLLNAAHIDLAGAVINNAGIPEFSV